MASGLKKAPSSGPAGPEGEGGLVAWRPIPVSQVLAESQLDQTDVAWGTFQGTRAWGQGNMGAHSACLEFEPRLIKGLSEQ